MECRRITGEKGPYPSSVPGNVIEWGDENSGFATRFHKVEFAGPLTRVAYGAFARTNGVGHAYRLFFDDGSVFEITDG